MKKILFGLCLLLSLHAENTYNIQANLGSLGAEMGISENISLSLHGANSATDSVVSMITQKVSAYGVSTRLSYFLSKVYSDSMYVGIYSTYSMTDGYVIANSTTYDLTGDTFKLGALVGYRWMWEHLNVSWDIGYGLVTGTALDKSLLYITNSAGSNFANITRALAPLYSSLYLGWAF